eukprot:CAMPEP_0197886716 /NCGR_PEP_ID=MMETSP1439-20131203/17424_1 /TAXON_ID=66791 /ORGANISM="Gonyaulax spinifera, Strain CCMP409" /LENGTH=288 /DNA_ID=CAMNT_0043506525 /DNA_START=344 /DNA_END=1209 /DNA_ORIENTATION=+
MTSRTAHAGGPPGAPASRRAQAAGQRARAPIAWSQPISKLALDYSFQLTKKGDAYGTLWSLAVSNGSALTPVGSIFVKQQGAGRDCSLLEPEAETSMEYYNGGSFRTEASWRGPFLGGEGGLAPDDVDVDCGSDDGAAGGAMIPAKVTSSIPEGPQGRSVLLFRRGSGIVHGCDRRSIWRSTTMPAKARSADPLAAHDPSGPADLPVMVWVGTGAVAVVGLATAFLAARHKCGGPGSLALEDDLDRKLAIRDDPRQRLALLNTDAGNDLASEASWTGSGHAEMSNELV